MKKSRIRAALAALLCIPALLCACGSSISPYNEVIILQSEDDKTAGGFRFEPYYHRYEIAITGYEGVSNDPVIPTVINDKPVTCIGEKAFANNTSLRSVVLPKGISQIKSYSFFNCTGLKKLILPPTVENIEPNAFAGCTALDEILWVGSERAWQALNVEQTNPELSRARTVFVCRFDGKDPVGHNYLEVRSTEPTCTAAGSRVYRCLGCDDSYRETTEKLGHLYEEAQTVAPTAAAGYTLYRCSRCGEEYKEYKNDQTAG